VYGSIVRGGSHQWSDLDIRYIRRPGFRHAVLALSFAARERIIALFSRIPLDLYVGDTEKFLDKMNSDEMPIMIKNEHGNIRAERYPNSVHLNEFIERSK